MKVYVITLTIDYEGAVALGAFDSEEKARKALKKDVDDDIADGYQIAECGGENFSYDCLAYYRLEKDDIEEDDYAPTYFYSLCELDVN